DAGDSGADWCELALDAGRRVGLHVPEVLLRRPAPEEDEDARLRLAQAQAVALRAGAGRLQPSRQPQRAPAELAQAAHRVPAVEHGRPPNDAGTMTGTCHGRDGMGRASYRRSLLAHRRRLGDLDVVRLDADLRLLVALLRLADEGVFPRALRLEVDATLER